MEASFILSLMKHQDLTWSDVLLTWVHDPLVKGRRGKMTERRRLIVLVEMVVIRSMPFPNILSKVYQTKEF